MRALLLAFFVGLALARVDEGGFQRNMHYVYRYEAQLATGAPQSSQLWSVLRLTADLNLYFLDNSRVTAILTNANLQKMDKFVEERTPSFFMFPEEKMLDGVEADIKNVMIQQLEKPFSCLWTQGHVHNVSFVRGDPVWSANIKRGVLSLFQVNLKEEFSVRRIANKGAEIKPNQPSFTVCESTTFGYCKTTYTPKPSDVPNGFYLTKVRDYSSCTKKNASMPLVFNNFRSEDKKNDTKHLDMQGKVTYVMKGKSKQDFLILTAIGESKIIFTPYAHQDGNVQTCINQTLYLHEARAIADPRPPFIKPTETQIDDSLRMVIPTQCLEDREPYVLHKFKDCQNQRLWSIDKMEQLLTWVANATDIYPTKDVLTLMQRLMEMIRQSNRQVLTQLLEKVKSERDYSANSLGQLKFQVLWELLSTAGTTECTNVLLDMCLKDCEQEPRPLYQQCINAVTSINLFSPPSEHILQKITVLLQMAKQVGEPMKEMKMVAVLCLGSVMGRAESYMNGIKHTLKEQLDDMQEILDMETAGERQKELQQTKELVANRLVQVSNRHHQISIKFTQTITEYFLDTGLDFDILLGLKALRNAHIPSSIQQIKRVLQNTQKDPVIRIAAAQALEKFCKGKAHKAVLSILEQVLKNPADLTSVRIQCFRSMVNVRAPVETLIRIAGSIRYEREKQLSTYVWSVFSEIANCSFRPYRQASEEIRSAMAFIEPVKVGVQDSHYRNVRLPVANNMDVLTEGSYVNTPEFVTSLDAASYLNMFGTTNKFVQISWLSGGLEQLIKKLTGPKGFFTDRNSLFDLLQRTKRGTDAKDVISDIFKKLAITARQIPQTKAFVNLQLMNSVVRSFDLTSILQKVVDLDVIQADIDERRLRAGIEFNHKTSGILGQFYTDLPTEAGFPVSLQMGLTYTAKFKGAVSAAVERSVYKQERDNMPPRKLKAGIYVEPQAVACVMGKMSVDGYLYQAGSLFHALAEFRSPFSINTSVDLRHNHLTLKFSPPVSPQEPVLKLEVEPYVYSLAMANNISLQQRPVNRRPLFITMQPLMIGDGAKIQEVRKTFGKESLGYDVRVQGQYPWRSLPTAPAWPLLGRANYAIYIRPGLQQPQCLRADFRYFSVPRYIDPKAPKKITCDSWMSWLGFGCVSTDDVEGVTRTTRDPNLKDMPISYPDFPDLSTRHSLNYASVKHKIENRFGHNIPPCSSGWAFIATFNSSTEEVERGATVECMVQSWKEGQYQQSFWALSRTPIPNYDSKEWKMNIKTSAFYPPKQYSIRDLFDPKHQHDVNTDLLQMLKTREHKVTNQYFQELLFTKINDYAIQRLPSMDPKMMLDRMLPEVVLKSNDTSVLNTMLILKRLLPVCDQLVELKDELKDAFMITHRESLLAELAFKISKIQLKTMELLTIIGEKPAASRELIAVAEYIMLKVSQAVFDFREIVQRACKLQLVSNINDFNKWMTDIDQHLLQIYKLAKIHLPRKEPNVPQSQRIASRPISYANIEEPYSRFSYDDYYSNPRDSVDKDSLIPPVWDVTSLISTLKALTREQLDCILQCWQGVINNRLVPKVTVAQLIQNTANNVTAINQHIQAEDFQNKAVMELLLQATVQHQICVDMMSMARFSNDTAADPILLDHFSHYAFKVQTKELLERSLILKDQQKLDQTCNESLTTQEKQLMKSLKQDDRELVALQQDRIRIPKNINPWTTNVQDLKNAIETTLEPVLDHCISVRDSLLQQPSMPHPCLVTKLVDTITTLQQKIDIFKRTIPAQQEESPLTTQYLQLDDSTMDFVLSLNAVFDKYINTDVTEEPELSGTSNILISQVLLEVTRIRNEQHRVGRQLRQYLFKAQVPFFDTVSRILNKANERCSMLKEQLVREAPRVKNSVQGTTALSAFSLYSLYYKALEEQVHLYDKLQQQLTLYAQRSSLPNIGPQIHDDKVEIGKLMTEISQWTVPSQQSPTLIPLASTLTPQGHQADQLDSWNYGYSWAQDDTEDTQSMENQEDEPIPEDVINTFEIQPVAPPNCKEILFTANITYGPLDTYIGIIVRARKSVDQLLWEKAQFYPERRDQCVARAVEQIIEGRQRLQPCCQDVERHINSYNNIHLQLDSDLGSLPPVAQYLVEKVEEKLEIDWHDRTSVSDPQTYIAPGALTAIWDVTQLMDCVDQYIMTEKETVTAECVPLNPYFKAWFPFQNVLPQSQIVTQQFSDYHEPAQCKVDQFNVRTTDGAVFQIPVVFAKKRDAGCKVLLAADCSQDQSFAILLQQSTIVPAQIVELLAEQHEIKLIPDYISDTVSIDGQEKELHYDSPIILTKKIAYLREAVAVVVRRQKGGAIHVEYPLVGLDIIFDFTYISIEMSSVYKQQLCGLCGNYDGQVTRDLEGPQQGAFSAANDFFRSYVIPDQQCPIRPQPLVPQYQQVYGPRRFQSEEMAGQGQPIDQGGFSQQM